MDPEVETVETPAETKETKKVYTRDDLDHAFKTDAYLEDFYKGKVTDSAMKFVLGYMPLLATRLPEMESFLDFGAGPTCHIAMIWRKKARNIYLADYLPQNREELMKWVQNKSSMDWTATARIIASHEGEISQSLTMEEEARRKVKGVLFCDMHRLNPLPNEAEPMMFDCVSTILCVEYSCLTETEYKAAIRNICRVVKPGGYFIVSGVMEEEWCGFGGMKFSQLFLTEELLLSALDEAGIETSGPKFTYLNADGIYLVCGQKRNEEPDKIEDQN